MRTPRALAAAVLLAAALPRAAFALNAAELKIYSPAVEYGEKEIEWRSFLSGKKSDHEQGHAMSVAYAPTSFWYAEVYEVLHKDPSLPLVADSIEIENGFQLSQPGSLWADLGVLTELEIAQRQGDPNAFALAPLLEKQIGPELFTVNLPLEWKFGPNFVPGTGFAYRARWQHLLSPYFSPAVEAFGEPGVIGRWLRADTQTHQLGPAAYGSVKWGQKQRLRYSVSSLFGLSTASPDWTLVTRLEFEF